MKRNMLKNIIRPKWVAGGILAAMLLLGYYYSNLSVRPSRRFTENIQELRLMKNDESKERPSLEEDVPPHYHQTKYSFYNNLAFNYSHDSDQEKGCHILHMQTADIDTLKEFPNFEFQPQWMRSKEYWNRSFEDRYEQQRKDPNRPPLKVIIVPHSHNDPGWLHTFEHYFQLETKRIINQIVAKLQQYPDMTFIWSEMSFLTAWWDSAHPTKQKALKKLIKSGQLEITTGGWVMPDEATTHIFALIDQFIEGHQWMKENLDITPKSGWSIDPFGHGATVPYLLSRSGIEGAIIQRLHYAWKQWFAQRQWGDFLWMPTWASSNPAVLLTHNQPFDIYSIKHSCGPHPYICLNFDFRKIKGEYTEYSVKAEFITDKNVKAKAELLLEQYAKTGSLLPHNVALIALGDDFRYNQDIEFDQQYVNYKTLATYINENKHLYNNAEIVFGTPKDYFKAIRERYDRFPTLRGDFFVYSDIFTEGRPAYWSGYYTTRPYLKIMDRELEHNLRNSEILFSIVLNTARQHGYKNILRLLEKNYENIIKARRNLGLFQHHDAITGTSKSSVMRDYGLKLFESLQDMVKLQESCLEIIYKNNSNVEKEQLRNFILSDMERESYDKLPRKLPVLVDKEKQIILFNSLAQKRFEVITTRVNTTNIKVLNSSGQLINFQINPVWFRNNFNKIEISSKEYEVMFIADLPPLSVVTYSILEDQNDTSKRATIYCDHCIYDYQQNVTLNGKDGMSSEQIQLNYNTESQSIKKVGVFNMKKTLPGDIQLENHRVKLLIDGVTGFLKSITKKKLRQIRQCAIEFSAYQSAQLHSGAYLFMPDINTPEKDVLEQYARGPDGMESQRSNIIIITAGPIATQVVVVYGRFLMHTLRIYNVENNYMSDAIYMENEVDFESPPKNRETELFVRIHTDVQNGEPPEFYTDQNGFQYQKRVKVEKISIEGNYFPITTMAFLQDKDWRFTYITGHAQGASSYEPGRLEIMLDRRTLYDDSRGMGEGLVDNRRTKFRSWLLSESLNPDSSRHKRYADEKVYDQVKFVKSRVDRAATKRDTPEGLRNFILSEPHESYPLPTKNALQLSQSLNYPVNVFIIDNLDKFTLNTKPVSLLNEDFPHDIHLVNLRTLTDPQFSQFPSKNALLILHKMGYQCAPNEDNVRSRMPKMFPFSGLKEERLTLTTLTGLHTIHRLNSLHNLELQPMELYTVNVTFHDGKSLDQY